MQSTDRESSLNIFLHQNTTAGMFYEYLFTDSSIIMNSRIFLIFNNFIASPNCQ